MLTLSVAALWVCFVLGGVLGMGAYAALLLQPPAWLKAWAAGSSLIVPGFVALLTLVLMLLSVATFTVVAPVAYGYLVRVQPCAAKVVRQKLLTTMIDPLCRGPLHALTGKTEDMAIACYAGLLLSFGALTVMLRDVGILAFGSLAASRFLNGINSVASEPAGIHTLRKRGLMRKAETIRQRLHVNMEALELRNQLEDFLSSSPEDGVQTITVELLVVLAAGFCGGCADSMRLRHLVIKRGYTRLRYMIGLCAQTLGRHDLTVDLFERKAVANKCDLTKEPWFAHGQKCPWQLALEENHVGRMHNELVRMGVFAGDGAFTWVPAAGGVWWTVDADDKAGVVALLGSLEEQEARLNNALYYTPDLDIPAEDRAQAVRRLVKAGADVNYGPPALNGWTVLHGTVVGSDALQVAEALLDAGADPGACWNGFTPLDYVRQCELPWASQYEELFERKAAETAKAA